MAAVRFRESDRRRLVSAAYDCALAPEAWPELLRMLVGHAGAVGASVSERVGQSARIVHSTMAPSATTAYDRYWGQRDPCIAPINAMRPGFVTTSRIACPDIETTSFYNEYARSVGRDDWLILNTSKEGARRSQILIARASGDAPFGADEVSAFCFMSPHLLKATQVGAAHAAALERLSALEAGWDEQPEALFVITPDRRLVHANRAGRDLLMRGDTLRLVAGVLTSPNLGDFRRLEAAVQRVGAEARARGAGAEYAALSGAGGELLVATLSATSAGHLVVSLRAAGAETLRLDARIVREMFGLTAAETDVLIRACEGATAAEIAAARGVKLTTVRWQVRRGLEKLGAANLRHAAAIVARLPTPPHN